MESLIFLFPYFTVNGFFFLELKCMSFPSDMFLASGNIVPSGPLILAIACDVIPFHFCYGFYTTVITSHILSWSLATIVAYEYLYISKNTNYIKILFSCTSILEYNGNA